MKADMYTKGVLTVIAACLVVLAAGQLSVVPEANAVPTTPGYASAPANPDGSITVRFAPDQVLDVRLREVQSSLSNPVPVTIKSTSGNVPVSIRDVDTYDYLYVKQK